MRKQFDIKYRPQIESGEYKVETRDGNSVRIICWDKDGVNPLVALITMYSDYDQSITEFVFTYNINGHYMARFESKHDLFIVTPEKELTEFEEALESFYNHHLQVCSYDNQGTVEDSLHHWADKLLALARKELEPEVLKRLEEAYKNQDEVVYENGKRDGKAEALKDLPRWNPALVCFAGDRLPRINWLLKRLVAKFEEGIFYLDINDLYKLPGFKALEEE